MNRICLLSEESVVSLDDIAEFPALQLRSDRHNGALIARTATKAGEEVLNQ